MDSESEFGRLLDELLADVDMADEVARKMAYSRCLEYANAELADDSDVNRFLALASERLGQTLVHFRVVEGMVQRPEDARLHLAYTENGGPCLTGNPSGLRYLSDLAAVLSSAPSPHEHVHLYPGEAPMFGNSYGLTLYNEPDEWFDRYGMAPDDANDDESADDTGDPPREIFVDAIVALEFYDSSPLPPTLYLSFDKIYRVLGCRPYRGEDVWLKAEAEDNRERIYIFSIHDDSDALFEIALHLDDPLIRYYTRKELEQILTPNLE